MGFKNLSASAVVILGCAPAGAVGLGIPDPGSAGGAKAHAQIEPRVFHASAKVEIGPTGEIVGVVPDSQLGAEIGRAVERWLRVLSFTPAAVNGTPVAGTTYVRMMGCALPVSQETYRLAFAYSSHGPGYSKLPHPNYPATALRNGDSGDFDVQVSLQPDGTARLVNVTATRGGARAQKAFTASIEGWVSALRYEPETVDGKAVSTTLSIPLEYRLDPGPSPRKLRADQQKLRREHLQSDACQLAFGREREHRQESIALDSPFGVKEGG